MSKLIAKVFENNEKVEGGLVELSNGFTTLRGVVASVDENGFVVDWEDGARTVEIQSDYELVVQSSMSKIADISSIVQSLQDSGILHPDTAAAHGQLATGLITGIAGMLAGGVAQVRHQQKKEQKDPWHVDNVRELVRKDKEASTIKTSFDLSSILQGVHPTTAFLTGAGLAAAGYFAGGGLKAKSVWQDDDIEEWSKSKSIESGKCHACDKSAKKFRDEASQAHYQTNGYCQKCQDTVRASLEN